MFDKDAFYFESVPPKAIHAYFGCLWLLFCNAQLFCFCFFKKRKKLDNHHHHHHHHSSCQNSLKVRRTEKAMRGFYFLQQTWLLRNHSIHPHQLRVGVRLLVCKRSPPAARQQAGGKETAGLFLLSLLFIREHNSITCRLLFQVMNNCFVHVGVCVCVLPAFYLS